MVQLGKKQQKFVDQWLIDQITNETNGMSLTIDSVYNISGFLSGYRDIIESTYLERLSNTKSVESDPYLQLFEEFVNKSNIPYMKDYFHNQTNSEKWYGDVTYIHYTPQKRTNAAQILVEFSKDEVDHRTLGELLEYPEFAIDNYINSTPSPISKQEAAEIVYQENGTLLDLSIILFGLPYQPPDIKKSNQTYQDTLYFKEQLKSIQKNYDFVSVLTSQSQKQLMDSIDHPIASLSFKEQL